MPHHAAHHPGHTSDGLEEDQPCQPFIFAHGVLLYCGSGIFLPQCHGSVVFVARCEVEAPAEETDGGEREPVGPVCAGAVGDFLLCYCQYCTGRREGRWVLSVPSARRCRRGVARRARCGCTLIPAAVLGLGLGFVEAGGAGRCWRRFAVHTGVEDAAGRMRAAGGGFLLRIAS